MNILHGYISAYEGRHFHLLVLQRALRLVGYPRNVPLRFMSTGVILWQQGDQSASIMKRDVYEKRNHQVSRDAGNAHHHRYSGSPVS